MSWISGNCQDNRTWSCYYMNFDGTIWCRDYDGDFCPGSDDGGALVRWQDNRHKGGGW